MVSVVYLFLACGTLYVGFQATVKRKSKKNALWLTNSNCPAERSLSPLSTHIYIVRCWKEQTQYDDPNATRYSLEVPTTGRRYGYANAEELLEVLTRQLANSPYAAAGVHSNGQPTASYSSPSQGAACLSTPTATSQQASWSSLALKPLVNL